MKVRFWGVRGSIPVPGPNTVKYGGNTSCIEIRGDNDELLILDAGTGIRELGNFLIANDLKKGPLDINVMLTHTHWDHIQGIPLFAPSYINTTTITFRGPASFGGRLADIVSGQMNYSYYPVKLDELQAKIDFIEIQEDIFELNGFKIQTLYLNHPILDLGFRIEHKGKIFVSIYDFEPYTNIFRDDWEHMTDKQREEIDTDTLKEADKYVENMNRKVNELAMNADLLVYDSQYKQDEYESKKGWGHSTINYAVDCAIKSNVKRLSLFHHDPMRKDKDLDEFQKIARNLLVRQKRPDIHVFCARERLEVNLD